MSILYEKEKNLGIYEEEIKKLENNLIKKEEHLKTQYSFLKKEENKLTNILSIEKYEINDYKNVEKTKEEKWFGFNNNEDLLNIFYCLNLNPNWLKIDENNILDSQKPDILNILVKLCLYTSSKQALYYSNKWAENKIRTKGIEEFKRTFGYIYNFKEKEVDNKNIEFHNISGYLSTILRNRNIQKNNRSKKSTFIKFKLCTIEFHYSFLRILFL